jgi:hypothetical protein
MRAIPTIFVCSLTVFIAGVATRHYFSDQGRAHPDSQYTADSQQIAHQAAAPALTTAPVPIPPGFGSLVDSADASVAVALLAAAKVLTDLDKRIDFFSQHFVGKAYDGSGPCGEGARDTVDSKPICNLNAFDCVTYAEHVLALALSRDTSHFINTLVALRYAGGRIDYLHRNHFFVLDWLANNRRLVTIAEPPRGIRLQRSVSKQSFFAAKGLTVMTADTIMDEIVWTPAVFREAISQNSLAAGSYLIVFFRRGETVVDANHVGLLLFGGKGLPRYRSATKLTSRVSEQELLPYLDKWGGKLEGIILAKITADATPLSANESADSETLQFSPTVAKGL